MVIGKPGFIRYFGHPSFAKHEIIGVELDIWSANAGDGTAKGEQLFATSGGR